MAKPVLNVLNAMSCDVDNLISFSWSGNAIKGNKIRVISGKSNQVVYENYEETVKYEQILPANSVSVSADDTQFIIQVSVTEEDGTESVWSDKTFAIFFHTPTYAFANVHNNDEIEASSYEVTVNYYQSEGELLKEYQFYLYDAMQNLKLTSDIMYDLSRIVFTYKGLENDVYYFRSKATTVNGYELDTGLVKVYVKYKSPVAYSTLVLTNHENDGYISYRTNIITIKYNGDEVFDFVDGRIDLNDKYIYYDNGFQIADDACFEIKGINMHVSGDKYFEASNGNYSFYITSFVYDDGLIRYKLLESNGLDNYLLYSPKASVSENDEVTIWVKRKNNVYQMVVYVNGEEVTD